jgi:D-serine deaminase-like pyridoxal phosphate-dependent protein
MEKNEIDTPALLLDLDIMEKNISEMAKYFKTKKASLRPHIKNHMSPIIAHKQMDAGAIGICCHTIGEAEIMAYSGLKNILLTNQIIGNHKIQRLINLTKQCDIIAIADNLKNVMELSKVASDKGVTIDVMVDVDTGYDRCGVQPGKPALLLAKKIVKSEGLNFKGINGYTPSNHEKDFIKRKERQEKMLKLDIDTKNLLEKNGIEVEIVSAGCTGDYNFSGEYPGIDEVQAGTYVFMDVNNSEIIGTTPVDLGYALTVLTTVISKPTEDRIIIDAGNKSLARENSIPKDLEGVELYRLSAEHGRVRLNNPSREIEVGDKIEFIPSYIDGTVNRWDKYLCIRNERLETIWDIHHVHQ